MIVCRLINIDRWVNFCVLLCGDDLDKNVVKAASDALALPTSCCKQQDLAQDVEICWKGYFEVTDKGTIFLDEIGEMPLSTQSRLLRILCSFILNFFNFN